MLIFSDTHLGDGGPRDDFDADTTTILCDLLSDHRKQGDVIIAAGDIIDWTQIRDLYTIQYAHKDLINHMLNTVDIFLQGNHDPLPDFYGRPTQTLFYDEGILVEHGNKGDPFNSGWIGSRIGRAATRVAGWAEAVIHRDADKWLSRKAKSLLGMGRYGTTARYFDYAVERMRTFGADSVVMGHTHKWAMMPPYLNCGHWTGKIQDAEGRFVCLPLSDDKPIRRTADCRRLG